jgi:hypothetical protein
VDPERRLRQAYLHHRLRNEALLQDLATLTDAFGAAGIEALVLKGPWLAYGAYPDPGTRPIGDIDLCVREWDYPRVLSTLREIGWTTSQQLPEKPITALRSAHYREQLRLGARGRRPIEIHFRLVPVGPPAADDDWVWATARELQVGRTRIRVPGPEAMLLQLLLHANQHGFALLRLLHDVRWALERDGRALDMAILLERIRSLRCSTAAFHTFELAQELAGADVSCIDLQALKPSRTRRIWFSAVWALHAARRLEPRRRRTHLEAPRLYLLEMGRARDKLRYALEVARGGRLGSLARRSLPSLNAGDRGAPVR